MPAFLIGKAMEFLLDLDLDWLCLAAEFAAGLLLLSMAWRPAREPSTESEPSAKSIDWEPIQTAFVHAITSLGRCISLRANSVDEDRLRCLQQELPLPLRDRLTGTWSSHGMDRLHEAWRKEPELHGYPSCYVSITLTDQDGLMEQHGAICVEHALQRMSELLVAAFSGQASLSRYQPNRFLIHFYGVSLSESRAYITPALEQMNAPEFFSMHGESIAIRCTSHYWFCNRSIEIEELLQLLDDGGDPVSDASGKRPESSESNDEAVDAECEREPEAVPEKPFSIADLATFPSPWDDPPEENPPSDSSSKSAEHTDLGADSTNADLEPNIEPETEPTLEASMADTTESVEGFASPEDIANLLAQLQPKTNSATQLRASNNIAPAETVSTSDSQTAVSAVEDHVESESEAAQQDTAKLEMPPMVPESAKTRSIYTDDIEDTVLKSDLASLFATVRSSAVGDFGYEAASNTGAHLESGSEQK